MHTRPRWFAPSSLRALSLLAALLLATTARAGFLTTDSTYMGYRIPEHRWKYWTATVNASGNHNAASLSGDRENHDGNVFLGLGTGASWSYDSDRLQHDWGFNTSVAGSRQSQRVTEREQQPVIYDRDASLRDLNEYFTLSGSLRHYPWNTPIGFTVGGATSLSLTQSFTSENYSNRSPFDRYASTFGSSRGYRSYIGSIRAGLGLGRVRDVTPVHRAQVLENRLLRQHSLTRPLSGPTRDKLAALFAVEPDVFAAHERPGKFFWREIERILREDGGLAEGALDAYDVLRLLESISFGKGTIRRTAGFFVGPNVDVRTGRFHSTQEDTYSNIYYVADTVVATNEDSFKRTRNDRRDDVFVTFGAEFYRPLTPNWQLDAYSFAGIQEAGEFPSFTNSLAVTWIVTDRWLGGAQAYQVATGNGHSRHFDKWRAELRGNISYFLEDHWALTLTAFEGQTRDASGLQKRGGFSLLMTWIVSGLFEAPGLLGPMRPTPSVP